MLPQPEPVHRTADSYQPQPEDPGPLRGAHTAKFSALLGELGASLLVTTYQAGKLVMVRDDGGHLNTHYRTFASPMGLALTGLTAFWPSIFPVLFGC